MAIIESIISGGGGSGLGQANSEVFTSTTSHTVTHNLNRSVVIQVFNNSGDQITSGVDIDILNSNSFRISSATAISGTVVYF